MSHIEIKELIYDLENILKTDIRFKKNKDNKYKKNIKNIYIKTLLNKNNSYNPVFIQTACPECKTNTCPKTACIECKTHTCPNTSCPECKTHVCAKTTCSECKTHTCPNEIIVEQGFADIDKKLEKLINKL